VLKDLQVALSRLGRSYVRLSFADGDGDRAVANEDFREANVDVSGLNGMVLDDDVRTRADTAHQALNAAALARESKAHQTAITALTSAQNGIADRIRTVYQGTTP
jgi:hypothetical protein